MSDTMSEAQLDYVIALEQAGEAVGALSCPYYNSRGQCASGCYTEPSCQTDRPTEGWAQQLLDAAQRIKKAEAS